MSHSEDFFKAAAQISSERFHKINDAVLCYNTRAALDIFHYYDFVARTVVTRMENKEHFNLCHFRDADRDTLGFMREKLVELGGTPPALPPADGTRALIAKNTP